MDNQKELYEIKHLLENKYYKSAVNKIKKLYKENPNDINIKYVLALTLSKFDLTLSDSKKIFIELLNTKYKYDSLLELGKIELKENNLVNSKKCFNYLVNNFNDTSAIYGLGIIELRKNNLEQAKKYFNHLVLLQSKHKDEALLKLIYIELIEDNFDEVYRLLNMIDYNSEQVKEISKIKSILNLKNNFLISKEKYNIKKKLQYISY